MKKFVTIRRLLEQLSDEDIDLERIAVDPKELRGIDLDDEEEPDDD
ncbi:hypothetical protein ACFLX4_01205 [Chloroflexota bacterium]